MSQPVFSFEERVGLLFTVEGATYAIPLITIYTEFLFILQSIDMCSHRHPSLRPGP